MDGDGSAAKKKREAELEGEEAGGVIEHALAFYETGEAGRDAERSGDGAGGDGVRGSDDSAEEEAAALAAEHEEMSPEDIQAAIEAELGGKSRR